MSFYTGFYKLFSSPLKKIFRLEIKGAENLVHGEGALLCANHTSLLDVFVISAGLDRQVRYMAKKELFKIPLLKQLIVALGAYPVDRKGADVAAIRKTVSLIENGELVGVFPQGTRHPYVDPKTTEVKNGVGMIAYRAKCNVIPVYIKTKKNHVVMFRKTEIIVGKPISYEELGFENGGSKEYKAASEKIFQKVCELGE